jgi:hypothetical protein
LQRGFKIWLNNFSTDCKSVRNDLRTIVRNELTLENEKLLKIYTKTAFLTEALWAVHELKATIDVAVGCGIGKGIKVFDIIPEMTVSHNPKTWWVGLTFPKEEFASLHGDLTWHVTIYRKDGTAREKSTTTGKFNYGRFFVNTDETVPSWGSTFKTEEPESISRITVEVLFKRNNEERRTKWKTVEKHENEEK